MAATTPKAFDEFKETLALTSRQKELVDGRETATRGYLRSAFPTTSSLPLNTMKLIGSASRGTLIRPIDDIDVLAQFTNKDSIFEQYRYDSQAFLYRVRDALKEVTTVKIVGARGQAVRFFYADAPHVDIAPVFAWNGGGYALPNGTGGWLTTDPFAQNTWLGERNSALGYRLRPLIRILKRWNNIHSRRLKSFHLEVMVASIFSSLNSDSRDALEKFFQWAQTSISVYDPAGHGGDLSSYLTYNTRSDLITSLESSRARAANANAAERRGDHQESIRLWRIILGDEFPAYG